MKDLVRIQVLYSRFLKQDLSAEEQLQLMHFFDSCTETEMESILGVLSETENIAVESPDLLEERVQKIYGQLQAYTHTPEKRPSIPLWRWVAVAASVLIVAFGSYYIFEGRQQAPQIELSQRYGDDVGPGGNKATIRLSDGTLVQLAEDKNEIRTDGASYTYEDGEELLGASGMAQSATLSTPRGGQYRIVLPDGTKVWLNAESSLTYPMKFDGDKRVVSLVGEAFFDVAKNKAKPFTVKTEQQQITVTGTTFNIHAYGGVPTTTTLVSGQVDVRKSTGTKEGVILKPGQQAVLKEGALVAKAVDTKPIVGWVEGEFVFRYNTLEEILPQLARWYDVDIDIQNIPDEEFYADISRDMPLSTVLRAIEETSTIRFEIKGRRLTLKK